MRLCSWGIAVEIVPSTPQECASRIVRRSRLRIPCLSSWRQPWKSCFLHLQESVQSSTQEADSWICQCLRIMEAVGEVVPSTTQERVLNRPRKLFVDVPVPQHLGENCREGQVHWQSVHCASSIVMTWLAHWILWVSTSRAWTNSTCLVLEM